MLWGFGLLNLEAYITRAMGLECRSCRCQQGQAGTRLQRDCSGQWVYSECPAPSPASSPALTSASSPVWAAAIANGEVKLGGSADRKGMET